MEVYTPALCGFKKKHKISQQKLSCLLEYFIFIVEENFRSCFFKGRGMISVWQFPMGFPSTLHVHQGRQLSIYLFIPNVLINIKIVILTVRLDLLAYILNIVVDLSPFKTRNTIVCVCTIASRRKCHVITYISANHWRYSLFTD